MYNYTEINNSKTALKTSSIKNNNKISIIDGNGSNTSTTAISAINSTIKIPNNSRKSNY